MVALYQIINREISFVRMIDMEMPTDADSWLATNGFDRSHTLRRGKVIPITAAESRQLQREHDRLKRCGLLPSVAQRVIDKLTANH